MVTARRLLAILIVIAAHVRICIGEETEIFSCYDAHSSCVGQRVRYTYLDSELSAAIRRCCLNLNGLSYAASESTESCSRCTVYGFFESPAPGEQHVSSMTYLEGDTVTMSLSFGIIRGFPSSLRAFTFTTTDITTVPQDYFLPKQQLLITNQIAKPIGLRVIDDHVALEGIEQFRINPVSSLGQGEFALDIVISIADNNVVFVQFSENEYSVLESKSPAVVTISRTGAIARPLELAITPLAFQQVPFYFDALPEAEGLVPAEYSLLGRKDFDGSEQNVTFLQSDAEEWSINISISVFDNKVNGADKGFVVALELVGQDAIHGADATEQNVTVVRILNDDPLFVGFVDTSITAQEGDNAMVCLRILDPPTAVIISEVFKLQIHLQAASLHPTVSPTNLISNTFNNTSRDWCFHASANVDNAFDMEECVVYTASVINETVARSAGLDAGSGPYPVVVFPSSLTLTIVNVDAVHIGFLQQELTVLETQGYAGLRVGLFSGKMKDVVTLRLRTIDDTALAGNNYIPRDINFVFNGSTLDISIQLVVTSECDTTRCFCAQLSLVNQVPLVTIAPITAKICIKQASCIWITDKVSDDPLFMVHPSLTPTFTNTPPPALCYEVLGKPSSVFNMVSTRCTSVNVLYSSLDGQRNVISSLGLMAMDNSGGCVRVEVGADNCVPVVGGVGQSQYNRNGVSVVWSKGLVNIVAPDCDRGNIVLSISCNIIGEKAILEITIVRQLDHHPGSHGLLGQFWDATVDIRPYSGRVPVEFVNDSLYFLNVSLAGSANRQFLGSKFERTWDLTETACYYCGNIQGGRSHIVTAYDDAVIEGTFTDYVTEGIFSPSFKFSRFNLDQCL